MRSFKYLNRLQTAVLVPFVIGAICISVSEVFSLAAPLLRENYEILIYNLSKMFSRIIPYTFAYFLVSFSENAKRGLKSFWTVICLIVFVTCANSVTDISARLFFAFAIGLFCIFCFRKFNMITALTVAFFSAAIFGILIGYINDYWKNAIMVYSQFISEKGIVSSVLFGISDMFLSVFGDNTLQRLFFFNSFGGSLFIDGNIVTGVKDLFSSGYGGDYLSLYMSGHYLMLFAFLGMSLELIGELKATQKTVLILLCLCTVISGNFSLILIYFLLESPFLFLISLFICGLCYATAFVLKINIGYLSGGGMIEMITYGNNWIYLLASGIVFVAIGYFMFKFSVEKRGISDSLNIYIPTRLNNTVKALGGIENIIRFKDNTVEVRNPGIINTFMLECEIDGNTVKSNDRNFIDLHEYL